MGRQRTPVQDVRRLHRRLVLETLRDQGPQPRAALARRLGLSATTMTKVVAQLLDEGVVTADGLDDGSGRGPAKTVTTTVTTTAGETATTTQGSGQRVGRPSTDVRIRPEARYAVGIQVGTGTVQVGLCDLFCAVRHRDGFTFDVGSAPRAVLDLITARLTALLDTVDLDREHLVGIGVGAPGPVDPAHRRNVLSVNLGWRDVPFGDHLEQAFGTPTIVDHNVRAMALAEARRRVGEPANPLLYVHVRTGVGAGLVVDGRPFRSGTYGVTELGHLHVVSNGRQCSCGAFGCLETVVAEPSVARQALRVLGRESTRPLADLHTAADGGDGRATAAIDDLVDHLTTGLASAVNLLNPELILLGGIYANADDAPEPLLDHIRRALWGKAFPVLRDTVRVERPSLGRDVGVIGSAFTALDAFFYRS